MGLGRQSIIHSAVARLRRRRFQPSGSRAGRVTQSYQAAADSIRVGISQEAAQNQRSDKTVPKNPRMRQMGVSSPREAPERSSSGASHLQGSAIICLKFNA